MNEKKNWFSKHGRLAMTCSKLNLLSNALSTHIQHACPDFDAYISNLTNFFFQICLPSNRNVFPIFFFSRLKQPLFLFGFHCE